MSNPDQGGQRARALPGYSRPDPAEQQDEKPAAAASASPPASPAPEERTEPVIAPAKATAAARPRIGRLRSRPAIVAAGAVAALALAAVPALIFGGRPADTAGAAAQPTAVPAAAPVPVGSGTAGGTPGAPGAAAGSASARPSHAAAGPPPGAAAPTPGAGAGAPRSGAAAPAAGTAVPAPGTTAPAQGRATTRPDTPAPARTTATNQNGTSTRRSGTATTAPAARSSDGSVYSAVTGRGCIRNANQGFYTAGEGLSGWHTGTSGGVRNGGCSGRYDSMPLTGTSSHTNKRYMVWWFDAGNLNTDKCDLWIFVPTAANSADTASTAYFAVIPDKSSWSTIGRFSWSEKNRRNTWMYGGRYPMRSGNLAVKLTDRGSGRASAGAAMVKCYR